MTDGHKTQKPSIHRHLMPLFPQKMLLTGRGQCAKSHLRTEITDPPGVMIFVNARCHEAGQAAVFSASRIPTD